MKKLWLVGLLGLLLLAACGQTGSLYLPDSGGEERAVEQAQNGDAAAAE